MAKKISYKSGIVYSTDPDFKIETEDQEQNIIPAGKQVLKVILDKRQRAGKSVTLINGFEGNKIQLEELGKKLKTFCGTGGSVKEGQIIIQGDNREKILLWLQKNGYMQ